MRNIEWVEEKASGKISWKRRKIATVIGHVKEGDSIIVSELSRLGRFMLECMGILSIALDRQIGIDAVKDNW